MGPRADCAQHTSLPATVPRDTPIASSAGSSCSDQGPPLCRSAAARLNADNVQHTEDVLEAAEAAIEQGVYDEAISVLSSAIDDGDETPVLYHLRGRAWLKLGQPKKALRDLDTCLLAEPWFPEAYVERGHCHQVRPPHRCHSWRSRGANSNADPYPASNPNPI